MDTIETITAWHRETFPLATLESQLEKWDEEKKEYWTSLDDQENPNHYIDELADIFIVSCGLSRFSNILPMQGFSFINGVICNDNERARLEEAINAKMKINRSRIWEHNNGQYRHKEGKGL